MRLKLPVLIALLYCTACSDWVELDPTDTITTEAAFDSPRELETALTGVYHLVASEALAGRNWLLFSDLMAQNASLRQAEFEGFTNLRISSFNIRVEELWITSYRAVNQLNTLLAAIEVVAADDPDFTADEQQRMRGEAHFLRGAIYYYLVRYFALPHSPATLTDAGVPLVLEPVRSTTDFSYPARASIAAVYAQIEQDWELAYASLPPQAPSGKPGQTAAAAYLAKLAFERGLRANADQWSQVVLDADHHQLAATPQAFYRQEGSAEEIWSAAAAIGNTNTAGLNWAYGDATVQGTLIDDGYEALLTSRQRSALAQAGLQAVDLRGAAGEWIADPLLSSDRTKTLKYEEPGSSADDAPLLRLAEILLLRAETVARLGRTEEALTLLNRVRRRAFRVVEANGSFAGDPDPWVDYRSEDFPTPEDLLDAIVRERRVELAFEGNYLHDLIRLRRDVRQGVPWNDPHLRLPIPQRELDVNPNLVQNPGY
jgi:hypothetical protein